MIGAGMPTTLTPSDDPSVCDIVGLLATRIGSAVVVQYSREY